MKRILVVEDDGRVCRALKIRLTAAGYDVLAAADGVEGFEVAQAHRPDLAILDLCMPNGSGPAMAYRLRESCPEVPFIFVTASREDRLLQVAAQLHPVGVFEKPYEFADLLAAIEGTFGNRLRPADTAYSMAPRVT